MYIERKQDLSVYYFIKTLYNDAPFIKIVDDFPENLLTIPTIAVEADTIITMPYEMGNRDRMQLRTWYFDFFTENKAQRDEYGYRLLNALEQPIPVYDYDLGFPPAVVARLGAFNVDELQLSPIAVIPSESEKLYYRAVLKYVSSYNPC